MSGTEEEGCDAGPSAGPSPGVKRSRNEADQAPVPLSKSSIVYNAIWRDVRKSTESKYDHSSQLLKRAKKVNQPKKLHKVAPLQNLSKTDPISNYKTEDVGISSESTGVCSLGGCDAVVSSVSDTSVDTVHTYVHALKLFKAFVPCDSTFHHFVIQDLNIQTLSLKQHKYEYTSRRAIITDDGTNWVYWCSCNLSRASLMISLSHHVKADYASLCRGECLHICCSKCILEELDAIHMVVPACDFAGKNTLWWYHASLRFATADHSYSNQQCIEMTETIIAVGVDQALSVNADGDFGVVCLGHQGMFCTKCRHSANCKHIFHIRKHIESTSKEDLTPELQDFADFEVPSVLLKKKLPTALSKYPIPFTLPAFARDCLKKDHSLRFNMVDNIANLFPPDAPVCLGCGAQGCWSTLHVEEETFLVTLLCCYKAKVYTRSCKADGCSEKIQYGGEEECVLNMGVFCIAYEVLRSHMYHFFYGRTTMYTEYTVLQMLHSDVEEELILKAFKYNHFRCAWYSFIDLLDISYPDEFCCRVCGTNPSTVIMDGTSLSFRRALDSWKPLVDSVPSKNTDLKKGRFEERVFITNRKLRCLLKEFCKGITMEELKDLDDLVSVHAPSLLPLLRFLNQQIDTSTPVIQCPQPWAKLISALASQSPVCALLHPSDELFALLRRITEDEFTTYPSNMELLQKEVPILFDILSQTHLPKNAMAVLMSSLIKKANAPFQCMESKCEDDITPLADDLSDLSYFPHLSSVRTHGVYEADKHLRNAPGCTKLSSGHPSLLPGIFTLFCPHGICFGFQVMRLHESPRIPFSVLYTRFAQAPAKVIYDNACNLQAYCLNREPVYFMKSWFLVDRFHWRNHTACSAGYNMTSYPHLASINSEVVEQANALINKIKSSVSYMTAQNFMNHVKLFFWYHNRQKNLKL